MLFKIERKLQLLTIELLKNKLKSITKVYILFVKIHFSKITAYNPRQNVPQYIQVKDLSKFNGNEFAPCGDDIAE